jgi:hypothetical protein
MVDIFSLPLSSFLHVSVWRLPGPGIRKGAIKAFLPLSGRERNLFLRGQSSVQRLCNPRKGVMFIVYITEDWPVEWGLTRGAFSLILIPSPPFPETSLRDFPATNHAFTD